MESSNAEQGSDARPSLPEPVTDRRRDLLPRLAVVAAAERRYEPPTDVIARARAIFGRTPKRVEGLARVLARLIYDSLSDPLPAGIRAADRPAQVLYEAGRFAVDIQVNQERVGREHRAPRMVIVGQIADRRQPTRRLADRPVLLLSGKQVTARAVSNDRGEFHLESAPANRLRLQIPVDGDKAIEVPLHRFTRTATTARKNALRVAVAFLCSLLPISSAQGGERFLLRADKADLPAICETHGLRPIATVGEDSLSLVEAPDGADRDEVLARVAADARVLDFERDEWIHRKSDLQPSRPVATDGSVDARAADFFGRAAWIGYSDQPAGDLIGLPRLRTDGHTGKGAIVAIIDTGVDPDQPLLKGSLVPGYDFTRDLAGSASEWFDLAQQVVIIVEHKLTQQVVIIVEHKLAQQVVVIVELKQAAVSAPPTSVRLPAFFGHGTMLAGLVHLVAPEARIMPLKAFRSDGSSRTSDILRAIYYAAENGAKVINMSFSSESPAIKGAIQYATNKGAICVAAVGNEGRETIVYPAAFKRVFGVASTTPLDERAPFSNYGERLVKLAAPGEDVITTFPGGMYAVVSGTSFSAALVSGAAAVLAGVRSTIDYKDATVAFEHSRYISEVMGWGRVDIPSAVAALPAAGGDDGERRK